MLIPAFRLVSPKGRILLDTPELLLPDGARIAVMGPSGAGKSLFIKQLFGLAAPMKSPPLKAGSSALLMVQDPSGGLTPGLKISGHFRELLGSNFRDSVLPILKKLGLPADTPNRYPISFSGGECQRIMFALLQCRKPKVLVCDEPAASLDAQAENEWIFYLRELHQQEPFTLIFVTHQVNLLRSMADHLLVIEEGRLVYQGPPGELPTTGLSLFTGRLAQFIAESESGPGLPPQEHGLLFLPHRVSTSKQTIFELKEISKRYGEHQVLNNFSMSFQAGDWWWCLGRSGSGKTTLAKIVGGLNEPDQGTMRFHGQELPFPLQKRPRALRRKIQFLFQHSHTAFNPARNVAPQLAEAFGDHGDEIQRYLRYLGLDHLNLSNLPRAFSMGERQRLCLIRALGPRPDLLICDEPTAALDPWNRELFKSALEELHDQTGLTVLWITHTPELVGSTPKL